jgi:hypothetical protein
LQPFTTSGKVGRWPSSDVVVKRFGSFDAAIRAAGLEPQRGKRSAKARRKQSERQRAYYAIPENRRRASEAQQRSYANGRKQSAEVRQKISETLRGRKLSPEHRQAISAGVQRYLAARDAA